MALPWRTFQKDPSMNILWLFDTLGLIIGPLMLVALLAALVMCGVASSRTAAPRSRQRALSWAFAPAVVGVLGFLFGIVICLANGIAINWLAVAKCILAGAVVTIIPLTWALLLRRRGR